ncbi:MAG: hypothetical protein O3C39_02085 [Planctomycetota bacterium]|jgi:hypothetical protein|nr:hypothetical protein [Pirellulales bacterium]MDA1200451.1 hypothetical protein [Planctomycetota bacterium]
MACHPRRLRCSCWIHLATRLLLAVSTVTLMAYADEGDPAGSPAQPTAGQPPPPGPPPYWQAPALPAAVIQGGAIPPGWQPQAMPYQGIGPDGQPLTMYFAPTYVFTYQAGPPVPAPSPVNRRGWWGRPAAATSQTTSGWNYATSGAPPVTLTLPPDGPR